MSLHDLDLDELFTLDGTDFDADTGEHDVAALFEAANAGIDHEQMGSNADANDVRSASSSLSPVPEEIDQQGTPTETEGIQGPEDAQDSESDIRVSNTIESRHGVPGQSASRIERQAHRRAAEPHAHPEPQSALHPTYQRLYNGPQAIAGENQQILNTPPVQTAQNIAFGNSSNDTRERSHMREQTLDYGIFNNPLESMGTSSYADRDQSGTPLGSLPPRAPVPFHGHHHHHHHHHHGGRLHHHHNHGQNSYFNHGFQAAQSTPDTAFHHATGMPLHGNPNFQSPNTSMQAAVVNTHQTSPFANHHLNTRDGDSNGSMQSPIANTQQSSPFVNSPMGTGHGFTAGGMQAPSIDTRNASPFSNPQMNAGGGILTSALQTPFMGSGNASNLRHSPMHQSQGTPAGGLQSHTMNRPHTASTFTNSPAAAGGEYYAGSMRAADVDTGHISQLANTSMSPRHGMLPPPPIPSTLEPNMDHMFSELSRVPMERLFHQMGRNAELIRAQSELRAQNYAPGQRQLRPLLPSTPVPNIPNTATNSAFNAHPDDDVFGRENTGGSRADPSQISQSQADRHMRYRSIQEATAAARSHIPLDFIPVLDNSFPRTAEQEFPYAARIFNAMMNCRRAEDNRQMVEQWKRNTMHDAELIEVRVWEVLKRIMDYFNQPGFLKTRHHYPAGHRKSATFAEHVGKVVSALERNKTICRHFMTESYIDGLIDDPEGSVSRVQNNRKVNAEKKKKSIAGQQALEEVRRKSQTSLGSSTMPTAANSPDSGLQLATASASHSYTSATVAPQSSDYSADRSSAARTPGGQMSQTPSQPPARRRKRARTSTGEDDDDESFFRSTRRRDSDDGFGSPHPRR